MTRFGRLATITAAALSLAACLLPEKFEASVRFKPDGGYTYEYEGTAVHLLAAAVIKEKGGLPAKDEDGLRREAEKALKTPGIQKMTYSGNGRFEVRLEEEVKPGRQVSTLKIFNITRDKGGTYSLSVPTMKDKDRNDLRSLGIKVDGKAEVFLPGNAKVLEHNASSTPGLISKAYTWRIGTVDDRPVIRFTLTQ